MPDKNRLREDQPITIMYLIDTFVSPPGNPHKGGAERQLFLLASSLNPSMFRVIVVQLTPLRYIHAMTGNWGGVKFFHLPTSRFYGISGVQSLRSLYEIAKRENVNFIHTFFEKSEVMGWLTSRLAHIPIWITSKRDLGFKRNNIYRVISRFTYKDCVGFVANCEAVRKEMVTQEGLTKKKVRVIYNGMDVSSYESRVTSNELRRKLSIPQNKKLVGMIANMNFEIKGQRYFLEAASQILNVEPETEFLLVGDGAFRNNYEDIARALGIYTKTHFLGNRNDIAEILSLLDISVLCSTSEGMSNVILESMAAAKPVVASNVGGSAEMLTNGENGFLVPAGEVSSLARAIITLLRDPERARVMGETGKNVVKCKFTIAAMVSQYEELYLQLARTISVSQSLGKSVIF